MRNRSGYWILVVCLVAGASVHAATQMSVQVREGQLRERPSFLGTVVAQVEYGERVSVERSQGPWRYAVSGDNAGWIHESALTRTRIRLAAGEEDALEAASLDELAAAGKGFTQEVETEYKQRNPAVDFTWVDRMGAMGKRPEKLIEFLRQGNIEPREGARP
jgi:hypothetical protein